jgi:curved DNA-binding protein CbpA
MKDYYRILGVERSATAETVKAAYLRLAKKFHPDVNPDCKDWAAVMFKEAQEAYECLSDPAKRRVYDLAGRVRSMPQNQQSVNVKEPITVAIDFLVRAASPYVPPDQMKELLDRALAEYQVPTRPMSLVDLAERVGFLKRRKGARRAS